MPEIYDKGITRRFTPEMAMSIQKRSSELEDEVLRLKAINSTQLDTYQHMFDAMVAERKHLIEERRADDARELEFKKRIKEKDSEIIIAKKYASTFRAENNRLRTRLELKSNDIAAKLEIDKAKDLCDD